MSVDVSYTFTVEGHALTLKYSAEDKGYISTSKTLPGFSAFGATASEAIQETREAVPGYIEILRDTEIATARLKALTGE